MRDLIIIGAGPAGLAAAIYGKRAGYDTVVIDETGMGGGQIINTYEVDNYPGIPGVSGFELGEKLKDHALAQGAEFIDASVIKVEKKGDVFEVTTTEDVEMTDSLIIATGATYRSLGAPGEQELVGMGVSYCATCDGAFFRNRTVAVVGGGDVAVEDALFLARGCSKVYLIHRRDEFRAAKKLQEAAKTTDNIEIIYDTVVEKINGEDQVESINIKNVKSGKEDKLDVDGVFIAVGMSPKTDIFKDLVELDSAGYVVAGEDCKTNVPGLFVAGDVRTKILRQVITAAADGAVAVTAVNEYKNA